MSVFGAVVFFILGAFAGSFDNLMVYRYAHGKTLFFPKPRRCEICKHDLTWMDQIPLVSYFSLGGKCRYCDEKISRLHPALEAITGVLFLLLFLQYGWSLKTVAGCLMTMALMISILSDLQYGRVFLNGVAYAAIGIGVVCSVFTDVGWQSSLFGMFLFAIIYAIIYLLSRGSMGGGDVKVAAIVGAFCGLPGVFLTFVLSSFMAAVIAVILMLFFRKRKRVNLRFVPFLVVSGFLAYAYGTELINLYASFFPA